MKVQPTILVIFGISGDLATRFLLKSLAKIAQAGMLPEVFHIVGVTRQSDLKVNSLFKDKESLKALEKNIEIFPMDTDIPSEYERLNQHLLVIEKGDKKRFQRIFYLSIPPIAARDVIEKIGRSSLAKKNPKKILLEKPFGIDLSSATELARHVDKYFKKEEIYRTDHYLAKETAQNIIIFREKNSLFKKIWNSEFIDSIEIIASESLGIEGRAQFYEQTGALRDVVQSHLLQLLALVLMKLPQKGEQISELRYEALRNLSVVCNIEKNECVKRGQYKGYRKEVRNAKSQTETFVSINLQSSDPIWRRVPITLTAGKALDKKYTEIRINYRDDNKKTKDKLTFRLQPNAGIEFSIWTKIPGYEMKLKEEKLDFLFEDIYPELPEAYEQVLFNAIKGDHDLFTSSQEVLETWRILDSIQKSWQNSKSKIIIYKPGTKASEI